MASSVRGWLWRHRRTILGTSVLAAGAYAGYVLWRQKQELEEMVINSLLRESASEQEEARVRDHFDATQRECDAALKRELPKARAQLARLLDVHALRQQMRDEGSELSEERWRELQRLAFARMLAAVYALTLLSLRLRLHLNIVARYCLVETTAADANPAVLSREAKLRFLSVDSLCADGLEPLVTAVQEAVGARLRGFPLDRELSAQELRELLASMRHILEGGADHIGADGRLPAVRAALLDALKSSKTDANTGANGTDANVNANTNGKANAIANVKSNAKAGTYVNADANADADADADSQLEGLYTEVRQIVLSEPFRLALQDLLDVAFLAVSGPVDELFDPAQASNSKAGGAAASAGAGAARVLPMAKVVPKLMRMMPRVLDEGFDPLSVAFAVSSAPCLTELCWMVYSASPY